jgi:hypothetical protein
MLIYFGMGGEPSRRPEGPSEWPGMTYCTMKSCSQGKVQPAKGSQREMKR